MKRNAVALVVLVLAQLGVEYVLDSFPARLVGWSWEVRLGVVASVFLAVGAFAYLLFIGKPSRRLGWVVASTALPPLIAEATSWSDAAYPHLNYLVAIVVAMVASLGALIAWVLTTKRTANS